MKKLVAEFIGTFALVFAGCGAVMVAERFPGMVPAVCIPMVFGLTVAAMIYSVGHISGAHFNPAVTLAFAIGRHFPKGEILGYWAAQFMGAIAASALLTALLPSGAAYGATIPAISVWQAFGWEVVLSFFLMFVIVSVATDTRSIGTMAGAAIGATVTLCAFVGGPVTGASMNPARTLGPGLMAGQFTGFWIYLVGPATGAVLAAIIYNAIRCEPAENSDAQAASDASGCC